MHIGLLLSSNDEKLLSFNEEIVAILNVMGHNQDIHEISLYYANRPEQLKKDVPYIIGLIKHYDLDEHNSEYSWNKSANLVLSNLVVPYCSKKQLMALAYLLPKTKLECQYFVDHKLKLPVKVIHGILDEAYLLEHYIELINIQNDSFFSDSYKAHRYLLAIRNLPLFNANPQHVWKALEVLDVSRRLSYIKDSSAFLHTLFATNNAKDYSEKLDQLQEDQHKKLPSTETIVTLNAKCREKVISSFKTLLLHWDSLSLPEEAVQRIKLLALQTWLSEETQKVPAFGLLMHMLNTDTSTLSEVAKAANVKHLTSTISVKNAKTLSLHDYVIEVYAKTVCAVMGWTQEQFKTLFPTVYSLIPFMNPKIKAAVWISKELQEDSGELTATVLKICEVHLSDLQENCASKAGDSLYTYNLENYRTKFTKRAINIIIFMYRNIVDGFTGITFAKTSFKELGTLLFSTFDIKKEPHIDINVNYKFFVDDTMTINNYLAIIQKGCPANVLIKHSNKVQSNTQAWRIQLLTLLKVLRNAKTAVNAESWLKFISNAPKHVVQSNWIESMASDCAPEKAPDSISQYIQMWAKAAFKEHVKLLTSTLLNQVNLCKADDSLEDFEDVVHGFTLLPEFTAKTHSNIPAFKVELDSEHEAFILEPGDPRALIIGTLSGCCQHVGGAAKAVAISSFTEPDQGVFVVAHKSGKVIAQSLIWHGEFKTPSKVKDEFKPKNFNHKIMAIDSVESKYIQFQGEDENASIAAKGYFAFCIAMAQHGYIIGIEYDNNSAGKRVFDNIQKTYEDKLHNYTPFKKLNAGSIPYQKKLGYTDFNASNCYAFVPKL